MTAEQQFEIPKTIHVSVTRDVYDRYDRSYVLTAACKEGDLKTAAAKAGSITHKKCAGVIITDDDDIARAVAELNRAGPFPRAMLGFNSVAKFESDFERRLTEHVHRHIGGGDPRRWPKQLQFWNWGRPHFPNLQADISRRLEILRGPFELANRGFLLSIQRQEAHRDYFWHKEFQGGHPPFFATRSLSEKGLHVSVDEDRNGWVTYAVASGQSLSILKSRVNHTSPVVSTPRWIYQVRPHGVEGISPNY